MEQLVDRHTAWRLALTLRRPGAESTLDAWPDGRSLPLGWHLVYCQESPGRDIMSPDGLPAHDASLPEHRYAQRLFGGASLEWRRAPRIGEVLRCEVVPGEFVEKQGRSGPLALYTFERRYWVGQELCVRETNHVIYRPAQLAEPTSVAAVPDRPPTPPTAAAGPWCDVGTVDIDEIDVFRLSALMFNSHRVHYDVAYAQGTEGHAGVLVQAKLQLLLALEYLPPQASCRHLSYRAHQTLTAPSTVTIQACHAKDRQPLALRVMKDDVTHFSLNL